MLSDAKLKRELASVLDFCRIFNKNTEGRYSREMGDVAKLLQSISVSIATETELRRKLESFKARGFDISNVFKIQYRSSSDLENSITQILKTIDELNYMLRSFNELQYNIPEEMKKKFLAVIYDSSKLKEARTIWGQIKSILEKRR